MKTSIYATTASIVYTNQCMYPICLLFYRAILYSLQRRQIKVYNRIQAVVYTFEDSNFSILFG